MATITGTVVSQSTSGSVSSHLASAASSMCSTFHIWVSDASSHSETNTLKVVGSWSRQRWLLWPNISCLLVYINVFIKRLAHHSSHYNYDLNVELLALLYRQSWFPWSLWQWYKPTAACRPRADTSKQRSVLLTFMSLCQLNRKSCQNSKISQNCPVYK